MVKKILIFCVAYYPKFVGGDGVAVKEITDRLSPDQYEFHLITLRFDKKLPKEEKLGNVFVYRLGFVGEMKEAADSLRFPLHYNKYIFPFLALRKALQLSKKNNFSLIWSIMANYGGFGALFFKLKRPKIPFLLTLQEGDPIEYIKGRVGIFYPLFKMIFTRADAIQAISNYLADFGKSMGFKGEPRVVANGVDISNFTKEISEEDRNKLRAELGLGGGDIALVTASRLAIKNGIGDVISALVKLPQNIKFVIIGEGYLREKLEKQVKTLGVEERVVFKGFLPHSQLPKYLKACDIFIRPSISEGFGNSFIEAMAAEIPVVATPVGGIVDFLFDPASQMSHGTANQTGYFCNPEDPQSIVEALKKVLNDPNRGQVTANAKNMVVEKYNWENITVQMKEIFDNML